MNLKFFILILYLDKNLKEIDNFDFNQFNNSKKLHYSTCNIFFVIYLDQNYKGQNFKVNLSILKLKNLIQKNYNLINNIQTENNLEKFFIILIINYNIETIILVII